MVNNFELGLSRVGVGNSSNDNSGDSGVGISRFLEPGNGVGWIVDNPSSPFRKDGTESKTNICI